MGRVQRVAAGAREVLSQWCRGIQMRFGKQVPIRGVCFVVPDGLSELLNAILYLRVGGGSRQKIDVTPILRNRLDTE
jgi:hypothetical protein